MMPRRSRIDAAGALHYVMVRGIEGLCQSPWAVGWGLPSSWQGWVVLCTFIALVALGYPTIQWNQARITYETL
jgi:hypothetical protein